MSKRKVQMIGFGEYWEAMTYLLNKLDY